MEIQEIYLNVEMRLKSTKNVRSVATFCFIDAVSEVSSRDAWNP